MAGIGKVILGLGVASAIGYVGWKAVQAAGSNGSTGSDENDDTLIEEEELEEVSLEETEIEDLYSDENDSQEHYALITALFAVAMASASTRGPVLENDQKRLISRVAGAGYTKLPEAVKTVFKRICAKPPTMSAAMKYVEKLDNQLRQVFDPLAEELEQELRGVAEVKVA